MYLHSRNKRWLGVLQKAAANLRLAAEQMRELDDARVQYGDRVRKMDERDKSVLILEARDSIGLMLESQRPVPDSWLQATLRHVIEAFENLSYGDEFIDSIKRLETAIEDAAPKLAERATEPDLSLDEIIDELERAMVISLVVTLTSHNVLVEKVSDWEQPHRRWMQGGNVPSDVGHYFDARTLTYADAPRSGLVHMQELILAIDAGTLLWVGGAGREELDNYPEVQAIAYAQWFTYAFALWEEQFRGRLVDYFNATSGDDDILRRSDFVIDFFGDIRLIRNDFVHNKGICKEAASTNVLQWRLEAGQPLEISALQMMSLVDLFPREELKTAPTRRPPGSRRGVPGRIDPHLLEDVQQRARELGLAENQVNEAAFTAWLADTAPK
jgi:hypothetical protein